MKPIVKASDVTVRRATDALGHLGLVLLHDAGRGCNAATDVLSRRTGDRWARINDDGDQFLNSADQTVTCLVVRDGFRWQNATLVIDDLLPETILASIPGRRLGDVVSGAGLEERAIASAESTASGTSIRIQDETVMLSTLRIGRMAEILGPLRRAWWAVITEMPPRRPTMKRI